MHITDDGPAGEYNRKSDIMCGSRRPCRWAEKTAVNDSNLNYVGRERYNCLLHIAGPVGTGRPGKGDNVTSIARISTDSAEVKLLLSSLFKGCTSSGDVAKSLYGAQA